MLEENFKAVVAALTELVQCYPRFRISDKGIDGMLRAFWEHLRSHERDAVMSAIKAAPEEFPKAMPSIGELLSLVRKHKSGGMSTEDQRRAEVRSREKSAAEEARKDVPLNPREQARCIAAAPNEFERMARYWEVEDANRGEHPYRDTPAATARERFRSIDALLAPLIDRSDDFKRSAGK